MKKTIFSILKPIALVSMLAFFAVLGFSCIYPTQPKGLEDADVTATPGETNISLSWTADSSADGYVVNIYKPSTNWSEPASWERYANTETTSITITNLDPGTTYTVRVYSSNEEGAGSASYAELFVTTTIPVANEVVLSNDNDLDTTLPSTSGATYMDGSYSRSYAKDLNSYKNDDLYDGYTATSEWYKFSAYKYTDLYAIEWTATDVEVEVYLNGATNNADSTGNDDGKVVISAGAIPGYSSTVYFRFVPTDGVSAGANYFKVSY